MSSVHIAFAWVEDKNRWREESEGRGVESDGGGEPLSTNKLQVNIGVQVFTTSVYMIAFFYFLFYIGNNSFYVFFFVAI